MQATEQFTQVVQDYLEKRASEDPLFAPKFSNEKKSIKDCVTYILNTVQKSGRAGFTDDEVYGMAVHYYDEENIEVGKAPSINKIIINQEVQLTPEEIEQAKKDAREKALGEIKREEASKVRAEAKKKPAADKPKGKKLTEAEKDEAKRIAQERIYEEELARLKAKRQKKEDPKVEQPTLF